MATVVAIIGWTVFGAAVFIGLVLDVLGLFGNWIIFAAVALAWAATGFAHFTGWAVLGLAALAVLGEVLETATAGYGARRFGGSRGAILAALVGCIAGAILGTPWLPVVGTLAGACLGAFAAATVYEVLMHEKSLDAAAWTGLGAALGKVGGILAKILVGLIMLLVAALSF